MSSKAVLAPYQTIINGTMTGTSLLTSLSTNVQRTDNIGISISWTGTPSGTFAVSTSMDNGKTDSYKPLTFSPVLTAATGSAGGFTIALEGLPFPWVQVTYTNTSGTGVLNVWITGKDT